MKDTKIIRLDRFLSNAGIASRKNIKRLLKQQEVTVNGKRVKSSGVRITIPEDEIAVDGERIYKKDFVYYALNKPKDTISTTADPAGRTNVTDLIKTTEKIYPIGRLDKDTHGLLLLTNDGNLTHKLIHPKYHIAKVYILLVSEPPTIEQFHALKTGVLLKDGITLPAEVEIIETTDEQSRIKMTIHEGRNRQIRRMCGTVGLDLLDLQRIQFGPVELGELPEGEYRELTHEEIAALKTATELKA